MNDLSNLIRKEKIYAGGSILALRVAHWEAKGHGVRYFPLRDPNGKHRGWELHITREPLAKLQAQGLCRNWHPCHH